MDMKKFYNAVKVSARNICIINIPVGFVVAYLQQYVLLCPVKPDDIPTLPRFIIHAAFVVFSQEVVFYYSHK